jgi:FAD/FMN-containing dehydrogenase
MDSIYVQNNQGNITELSDQAIQNFQSGLKGKLLTKSATEYNERRKVWNGMIDKYPALIVLCKQATDVQQTVNFARTHDIQISVRGGGHNVAGKALIDEGIVIDLSTMNHVQVDPKSQTVIVGGGATLGDIDRATQEYGLAVPVGVVSETGIGGLALHGGAGWLMRSKGLTMDNILAVEMVTADGQIRRADETENQDLFWAIRGGGGNFGVVTSFKFKAYPVGPEAWLLMTFHPVKHAKKAMQFYRDYMQTAPFI